jgi:hypothetical protein
LNLRPLGYERIEARDSSRLSTTRANSDNDFRAGESAGVAWVRPTFADRTRTVDALQASPSRSGFPPAVTHALARHGDSAPGSGPIAAKRLSSQGTDAILARHTRPGPQRRVGTCTSPPRGPREPSFVSDTVENRDLGDDDPLDVRSKARCAHTGLLDCGHGGLLGPILPPRSPDGAPATESDERGRRPSRPSADGR